MSAQVKKSERMAALQRQIDRVRQHETTLQAVSNRLSNFRLLAAVVGITITAVLFTINTAAAWLSLFLSLIVFGGLIWVHRRFEQSIAAHREWTTLKREHLARMTLDWAHLPPAIFRPSHMLEIDLDLANLHRLLNTTTSRAAGERLRAWLVAQTPDEAVIAVRQAQIGELVGQPIFRDKLILTARLSAQDLKHSAEGQSLVDWLAEHPSSSGTLRWLLILSVLSIFNIVTLILFFMGIIPGGVPSLGLSAYMLIFAWQYRRVFTIFEDALTIEGALRRLDAVMTHLEGWNYSAMPNIETLLKPVLTQQPSRRLREITRVLSGASLRGNPLFWLTINVLVPWDYYFGWRLEGVKQRLQGDLPAWLDVWYELEALGALAAFAYLNPSYTVPRIGGTLPSVFDAIAVGHPLIPDHQRVINDFRLTDLGDMVIITGSNMSGKSSFLRTLGVNLLLAYAGGHVCAVGLDTIIFRLYTSIRVTDSLDDGISYFYAEVRRLRGLLDALKQEDAAPLFFLIDEIFRGTNNRERLIGSRSFIRALVEQNAVGLVATHDLELVKLADENGRIRNAHFREDVVDGSMVFDYTLRRGPSPTTNALRIMAMEGLPVESEYLPD